MITREVMTATLLLAGFEPFIVGGDDPNRRNWVRCGEKIYGLKMHGRKVSREWISVAWMPRSVTSLGVVITWEAWATEKLQAFYLHIREEGHDDA